MQSTGFFHLPAEIRNVIYELYLSQDFVIEIMPKQARYISGIVSLTTSRQNQQSIAIRIGRKQGRYAGRFEARKSTKWSTSLSALHLVCKQMYEETVLYMYSQPKAFYFQSPKWIINFIRQSNRKGLKLITGVHIDLETYGDPCTLVTKPWQQKHYEAWTKCIKTMSEHMPNVKHIAITVMTLGSPVIFNFDQRWVQPLLMAQAFHRLQNATIRVLTPDYCGGLLVKDGRLRQPHVMNNAVNEAMLLMHDCFGHALEKHILHGFDQKRCMDELYDSFEHQFENSLPLLYKLARDYDRLKYALDWRRCMPGH